ncbi:MAG: hypothetical protein FWC67_05150 [Defluviitaleaceae bacterium]|nr:hypothetical protein [Defluviitaleaceae bacterium]
MKEIKSELLKFLGDDFDFDKHMHDVGDHDAHVIDALLMLEIAVSETEYNDFQKCCELAAPIFKRFSKMKLRGMDYKDYDDDNFYIVMCMVRVIGYAKDLTSFFAASIPLANELQRYSLTPDYLNDKMALHMNSLFRLLRARKYEFTNDGYAEDIKLHFEMHYKYTQDIFHKDHKRFMLRKLVADVRHGIFHKDKQTIKVALGAMKIFEYHDVIKIMHTEIDEYGCDCIKIKDE